MEFGKRLRMKRKTLGMSLEELANSAGCSRGLINQFECGILPKNLGKGAIARVKRILRVKVGGKHNGRKPSKSAPSRKPVQVMQLLNILVDEIRGLRAEVKALNPITVYKEGPALKRPMPSVLPAAGPAVLTGTDEKGSLLIDRRFPWKGTAKEA